MSWADILERFVGTMTLNGAPSAAWAGIFLLGFSIDLIYVWYIQAVVEHKKYKAATLSVMLAAPAMFGFFEVYENRWLALPYFFGLFSGTLAAIELKGRRDGN